MLPQRGVTFHTPLRPRPRALGTIALGNPRPPPRLPCTLCSPGPAAPGSLSAGSPAAISLLLHVVPSHSRSGQRLFDQGVDRRHQVEA